LSDAGASGQMTTTSIEPNLFTKSAADSRTPETSDRLAAVATCTFDNVDSRFECPYGPFTIHSRDIGAQSVLAVLVPANLFLYSAPTFLRAFELSVPRPQAAPGATVTSVISLPFLLDDPAIDPEEMVIDGPPLALSTANYPMQSGSPRVTVEARVPGIKGTAVV